MDHDHDETPCSNDAAPLPYDMQYQVLLRVPAFDLQVRCTLVCKQWRDWITSHEFVNDQLNHAGASKSVSQLSILLRWSRSSPPSWESHYDQVIWDLDDGKLISNQPHIRMLKLDFLRSGSTDGISFTIKSSCNGLLLVYGSRRELPPKILVCNPLTRFCVTIPDPPKVRGYPDLGLWLSWLIGYDSRAKMYKIGTMRACVAHRGCQAAVFSCTGKFPQAAVADGAWHLVDFNGKYAFQWGSVVAREKFIWLMLYEQSTDNALFEPCLLWYDMCTSQDSINTYGMATSLGLPRAASKEYGFHCSRVYEAANGKLSYLFTNFSQKTFEIWETGDWDTMKSWCRAHVISAEPRVFGDPSYFSACIVVVDAVTGQHSSERYSKLYQWITSKTYYMPMVAHTASLVSIF